LLVLSAANWTYTWYRPAGPLSPEEVADRFTDLLLAGMGTKEETT
jgi:TetR/AcrR family transcriptional regulator, cholesterol catabolism regulator